MAERKTADRGQSEVQAAVDEEQAKGYVGTVPDSTPNDAYTVAGVTQGAITPETDPSSAEKVRENFAPLTKDEKK